MAANAVASFVVARFVDVIILLRVGRNGRFYGALDAARGRRFLDLSGFIAAR
jgi:hypothetical protein